MSMQHGPTRPLDEDDDDVRRATRPCTPPPPLGRGGIPPMVHLAACLQASPLPPLDPSAPPAAWQGAPPTPPRLARTVPVWERTRSGALRHVGGAR